MRPRSANGAAATAASGRGAETSGRARIIAVVRTTRRYLNRRAAEIAGTANPVRLAVRLELERLAEELRNGEIRLGALGRVGR
jgi:hypothetical protein